MKPDKLRPGDTIATISPAWGVAGASDAKWRYEIGVQRLMDLGLHVLHAPNSLRGENFLEQNPQARADDLMWAFANTAIKGIIANIGGNSSDQLLPFLDPAIIQRNPKVLCGYSDITTLHLYCHKHGLSTFYGDNLLTNIAESGDWHPYSKHWFIKTLFESYPLGDISPSNEWSFEPNNLFNPEHRKQYVPSCGHILVQGTGIVQGKLFGGNAQTLMEAEQHGLLYPSDFENAILFLEDLPNAWSSANIQRFLNWLGKSGYLQRTNGIVLGKICAEQELYPYIKLIRSIISEQYSLPNLPVIYGLNFGHASPICILPYDAEAQIDSNTLRFSILESGVQ